MDALAFASLVGRVVTAAGEAKANSGGLTTWAEAAAHVADILTQYPEGVTAAALLSSMLQRTGQRRRRSLLSCSPSSSAAAAAAATLTLSRYVAPHQVLELTVHAALGKGMLDLERHSGPRLVHRVDARLTAAVAAAEASGKPLFSPGRRFRAVGTAVAETAASGDGALLLLPTRHIAPLLDRSADQPLLDLAVSLVRGQPTPPSTPLLLRLARVNGPECHQGRRLRRLLMCDPAAMEVPGLDGSNRRMCMHAGLHGTNRCMCMDTCGHACRQACHAYAFATPCMFHARQSHGGLASASYDLV